LGLARASYLMLLCMTYCGNLRRNTFRNSRNSYVIIEKVIHEKLFQMLVLNLLTGCCYQGRRVWRRFCIRQNS
jgi:hypothetical protein